MSSSTVETSFDPGLRLMLLPPESARELPPIHRDWLRAALLDDPRTSLEHVLEAIEQERAQLWAIGRHPGYVQALLVTRLVEYDRCWSMWVQLVGGAGMRGWLHLLPELEEHARRLGCRYIEGTARLGWLRLLPDWEPQFVAIAKEL